MAKVYALTTAQQTQAAADKTAMQTANTAAITARQTFINYLLSCAGVSTLPPGQRVQLSDDGTSVIIG